MKKCLLPMKNNISRREFILSVSSIGALMLIKPVDLFSGKADLPNVLIIGDSISIGYTPYLKDILMGKAIIAHPDENCEGTTKGVMKIDEWLGNTKWDIIHFNFGLHDLKHVNATTGAASTKPDDPRQADIKQYAKNLRLLVNRLKASGAKLIYCTTTPVPVKSSPFREPEQVIIYNNAALKIMKKEKIQVNDLYEFALPIIKQIQLPDNVHFTPDGYKILAEKVSGSIKECLK